jgi:predicted metal-dependent hydrolase
LSAIFVLLLILIIVTIAVFIKTRHNNVVYVKSDVDNSDYLVRDLEDKQQASNMLAKIKQNILYLTEYLKQNIDKYPNDHDYIEQLADRIKNVEVLESTEDSVYTSYSVNKGEQIVFCLRSRNIKNKIHKFNLLMYVVLHEMAHVACPEYGHTNLFKQIFAFLTTIAIQLNLYTKISFAENPEEYCGLMITDSII